MRRILIGLILGMFGLIISAGATPVKTEHVEAELVSEVQTIQPGRPFWVGVRLRMQPEWHVYWRNAGDAGLPTTITWQLPEGFQAGEIQWPYPIRFKLDDFVNFGYEDEVLLLTRITPPATLSPGQKVQLRANVEWLVCKDICVPESAELTLELPVAEAARINSRWVEAFAETRAKLPLKQSEWRVEAAIRDTTLVIVATPPAWFRGNFSSLLFFPYPEGIIHNAGEQVFEKVGPAYHLYVPLSPDRESDPKEISGILVCDTGWRGAGSEKALEFTAPIRSRLPVAPASTGSSDVSGLGLALVFAFLGGMILNLMPCVLPVLSLKILGFVQQAGESRSKAFQHGLIFTLGVLVSFWVLAGALLLLRAGGEQLGWGFQLQSPAFVTVLSVFLFLFGLSLFGVFEIGAALMGVGQKASGQSGVWGSFMSGVTATVVATPCTAPFMGSALGFALTQPPWASMLIFTFLGLGMAAPYVVFSATPALLKYLPKPGPWMETLKQFMGFLLMGTVIWLLWVLSIQTGAEGVLKLLITLLLVAAGAWVLGRWGHIAREKSTRLRARIVAAVLILLALGFSLHTIEPTAAMASPISQRSHGSIHWQPFSPERVQQLRREGKPVFIDFTAAWCLSCQVNEKVAFGSPEVQKAFEELGVVTLVADWTSRDETITRALAQFGRNSVPLYVLYPPDGSEPIILPEIITPGIVLEALEKIRP